jgi:hypothetical protein
LAAGADRVENRGVGDRRPSAGAAHRASGTVAPVNLNVAAGELRWQRLRRYAQPCGPAPPTLASHRFEPNAATCNYHGLIYGVFAYASGLFGRLSKEWTGPPSGVSPSVSW